MYIVTAVPAPRTGGGVRSVINALRIVEAVAELQPVSVADLTRRLQLPKTTVHRGVLTLQEAGWVRPAGTEIMRWRLTSKALTVALLSTSGFGIRDAALIEMRQIRDATGETIHLGVGQGDSLLIIARLDGTRSLRAYIPLGTKAPLVASASGRAWLSAMPDDFVEGLLKPDLHRYTDSTITNPDEIRRQIAEARERGYAVNEGEWRESIAAIGTVVLSPDGRPLATMSLSMPLSRFREIDVEATGIMLREAAHRTAEVGGVDIDFDWGL
jgi:IclR family acetate operon transcriptional repressor